MRNVLTKALQEIKINILCSLPFSELAVYEKMWTNSVQPGGPQMTTWRMRIAFWIPKSTNTHLEYVKL